MLFEALAVGIVIEVQEGQGYAREKEGLGLVVTGPIGDDAVLPEGKVPAAGLVAVGIVGLGLGADAGGGMGTPVGVVVHIAADAGLEGEVAERVVIVVLDQGLPAFRGGGIVQAVETIPVEADVIIQDSRSDPKLSRLFFR